MRRQAAMPKVPIARVAPLNSATSNSMVMPIGRPRRNSSARAAPVRPQQPVQDVIALQRRRDRHDAPASRQAEEVGAGAGHARAQQAQPRQAEMAEDQGIIAQRVEQDRQRPSPPAAARPATARWKNCAAPESPARRAGPRPAPRHEDAPHPPPAAAPGRSSSRIGRVKTSTASSGGDDSATDHSPMRTAMRTSRRSRGLVRRHVRPGHGRSPATPPWAGRCPAARRKKRRVAQRAGRQRFLAEMAQHHRVGGQDDHLRQLGGGQRHRQAQQLARLRRPGARGGGRMISGSGIGEIQMARTVIRAMA